jgi:DNA relaxase NicK
MRINFAGPKMKNGKPSTQILFSGAACREFEDDYNGSFIHLFRFLRAEHTELGYQTNENGEIISGVKLNGSFKRIDFAIDDFTGKELNIYDLKELSDNYHWTGPYRTVDIHSSSISNHGMIQSKGFTITFGSAGSNQLQIYDKYLEYQSKGKTFNGSNTWYRYEMRFVDPKADAVVKEFLFSNQNGTLSDFAYSLLFKQIKFRIPKETNKNKNYWDILPEWLEFLHYVKELDLKVDNLPVRTFEKKLDWVDYSLVTTFTQLYLAYRDDPDKFQEEMNKYINKGALKFTEQHLASINKYLKDNNKPVVTKKEYLKMTTRGLELK